MFKTANTLLVALVIIILAPLKGFAALRFRTLGHPTAAFELHIERVLFYLEHSNTRIGRLTALSVERGYVRIGSFANLTRHDYLMVLADFKRDHTHFRFGPADYALLRRPHSPIVAALHALQYYGYSWSNRIYLSAYSNTRTLESTLVHELNHVLNHSELHYYDSPIHAFEQEYRAFFCEAMFRGEPIHSPKYLNYLRQKVFSIYGTPAITDKSIPLRPTGFVLPTTRAWAVEWPQLSPG